MAAIDKLRVGIVGASASRGLASIAHILALQALPAFEIVAVCTARPESAEAAARRYGARLAFTDPAQMAAHPDPRGRACSGHPRNLTKSVPGFRECLGQVLA